MTASRSHSVPQQLPFNLLPLQQALLGVLPPSAPGLQIPVVPVPTPSYEQTSASRKLRDRAHFHHATPRTVVPYPRQQPTSSAKPPLTGRATRHHSSHQASCRTNIPNKTKP